MDEGKNWGGNRKGAGRVGVVKRKYCHFYLSQEEEAIDKKVIAAFKNAESQITRELAKTLNCKQYEVVESVHNQILAARERIMAKAIEAIEAEIEIIKAAILKEKRT